MAEPTDHTRPILCAAMQLLRANAPLIERRGLTLVGVALANLLDRSPVQLALPINRAHALDVTLDAVRERFGTAAITRGVLVGRHPGLTVPMLPD